MTLEEIVNHIVSIPAWVVAAIILGVLAGTKFGRNLLENLFITKSEGKAHEVSEETKKIIERFDERIKEYISSIDSGRANFATDSDPLTNGGSLEVNSTSTEQAIESRTDSMRPRQVAAERLYKFIKKPKPDEIMAALFHERQDNSEAFSSLISRQISSADTMRTVMTNIFILTTLFAMFVLWGFGAALKESTALAAMGAYASLAAFVVYIHRVATARSATLLSIKEDKMKIDELFHYLLHIKKGTTLTSNEVELIRLIYTNRFERERSVDHPYEVILKGVSNSTVLFKGGKVSNSRENKS